MTDSNLELLEAYLPKLIRLAQANIRDGYQGKIEAPDVALSVFRTVIRRCRDGVLDIDDDSRDLWTLLVVITLNTIRDKTRKLTAHKRDITREHRIDASDLGAELNSPPGPEEATELQDLIEALCEKLDDIEVKILLLLLEGHAQTEIADQLGVSERTVRRKRLKIQKRLTNMGIGDSPDS